MKPTDVREAKNALRHEVRARLNRITTAARAEGSAQACARLREQRLWREARSVLFYAPHGTEVDIWPLLHEALAVGITVALPRFEPLSQRYVGCRVEHLEAEVRVGHFGIREPLEGCVVEPLNRLDLILVPGLAFDLHGRRLGRGKGFYDQMLAEPHGVTCGVAFEEQIVRQVPIAPLDILLDCILTPTRWVDV